MNELTKRIVSCVLLLMIGLGCFFGISGWQSSPETHRTSIEYLNEKQATVMKLLRLPRQHLQLFRLCRETRAAPSQKSWLISRPTF